jgi:hypothetical protein
MLRGGPFNAWTRSPDLSNRLQNVGEYIRYRTSLPLRLNEFAILRANGPRNTNGMHTIRSP